MKNLHALIASFAFVSMGAAPALAQTVKPEFCDYFNKRGNYIEHFVLTQAEYTVGMGMKEIYAEADAVTALFMIDFWHGVDQNLKTATPQTIGDYFDLIQSAYRQATDRDAALLTDRGFEPQLKISRWGTEFKVTRQEMFDISLRNHARLKEFLVSGYPAPLEIILYLHGNMGVGGPYERIGSGLGSGKSLSMDDPVESLLGEGREIMINLPGSGPQVLSFICR